MPDPSAKGPSEQPPLPAGPGDSPAPPPHDDAPVGRYEANLQLILRRLADHERKSKPRWWWQGR